MWEDLQPRRRGTARLGCPPHAAAAAAPARLGARAGLPGRHQQRHHRGQPHRILWAVGRHCLRPSDGAQGLRLCHLHQRAVGAGLLGGEQAAWGGGAVALAGPSRGSASSRHPTLCATSCVQHREHFIDGKRVEAKAAVPRDHGGGKMTNKMFVGGLPEVSEEHFRSYFSAFGNVLVRGRAAARGGRQRRASAAPAGLSSLLGGRRRAAAGPRPLPAPACWAAGGEHPQNARGHGQGVWVCDV